MSLTKLISVNKQDQGQNVLNFTIAVELKRNFGLFPLAVLLFIPVHIVTAFLFNPKRGQREYVGGTWVNNDFSEYWNLNWGANDFDEFLPRLLVTFIGLVVLRYLVILLKRFVRWYKFFSNPDNKEKVQQNE